jgi:hypothetical protein
MNQPINTVPSQNTRSSAPLIIGGLIVFALAFWFFILPIINPPEQRTFSEVDTSKLEGAERLPEGFPTDIPVDTATIVEASSATHDFGKVEQWSVGYLSEMSQNYLDRTYSDFFIASGYTINSISRDTETVSIDATKGNTNTLVLIMKAREDQQKVLITHSRTQE